MQAEDEKHAQREKQGLNAGTSRGRGARRVPVHGQRIAAAEPFEVARDNAADLVKS
ncbi:MAG TPA: hypothetical protein VGL93_23235 [Streptosporangiaceae bacterium]